MTQQHPAYVSATFKKKLRRLFLPVLNKPLSQVMQFCMILRRFGLAIILDIYDLRCYADWLLALTQMPISVLEQFSSVKQVESYKQRILNQPNTQKNWTFIHYFELSQTDPKTWVNSDTMQNCTYWLTWLGNNKTDAKTILFSRQNFTQAKHPTNSPLQNIYSYRTSQLVTWTTWKEKQKRSHLGWYGEIWNPAQTRCWNGSKMWCISTKHCWHERRILIFHHERADEKWSTCENGEICVIVDTHL